MLPIPANGKFVLLIVFAAVIAGLNTFAKLDPELVWLPNVVQLLVTLEAMFTVPQGAQDKMRALMKGPAAAVLLLCGLGAGAGVACQGCQNGQLPPVVTPSVDLAVCVLDQYTAAPSCRPNGNWVLCVATIANACGADAASVEQVLTADRKARVADGFVLLSQDAGK
jgi:hypothetical protein